MTNKEQAGLIDRNAGARLRAVRSARGVSQSDLGEALGITFQQIQKYEKGSNRMSISRLVHICQVLNCHPMDIIGEDAASVNADLTDQAAELAQLRAGVRSIGKAIVAAGGKSDLVAALLRDGMSIASEKGHAAHAH